MVTAALVWLLLGALLVSFGLAALLGLLFWRACRVSPCLAPADGGDVYAEDYALLDQVAPGLEGFTPLEVATLQRNYLPMTDDERFRLDMVWRSIVDGEGAQP